MFQDESLAAKTTVTVTVLQFTCVKRIHFQKSAQLVPEDKGIL